MCMITYLYLVSEKHTQKNESIPLSNSFVRIYVFSFKKSKIGLFVFHKEKCLYSSFIKCKLYLKNSIKLIKKFFYDPPGEHFLSPLFPEARVISFVLIVLIKPF